MGICENQYKFVKEYALDKLNKTDVNMLELGDQILNNHQNFFNGIKTAKEYYTKNGYQHTSFDWNGQNGAIPVDLTTITDEYKDKYDLITDHGTSEHVHNQYNLFKNLHNWGKVGCIYVHCVPLEGEEHKSYLNYEFPPHGDYEYSSKFWEELSWENNYELIISKGDLVSNLALNYPKNFYSASSYRKVNNDEFMTKDKFDDIFHKHCKRTTQKMSRQGHDEWKASLPSYLREKYKL